MNVISIGILSEQKTHYDYSLIYVFTFFNKDQVSSKYYVRRQKQSYYMTFYQNHVPDTL